jgi:hypothetical protein
MRPGYARFAGYGGDGGTCDASPVRAFSSGIELRRARGAALH